MGSGFFWDAGVKKLATDFSVEHESDLSKLLDRRAKNSLVTVATFRRSGGGETARVGEAARLTPPSDILRARVREIVVTVV